MRRNNMDEDIKCAECNKLNDENMICSDCYNDVLKEKEDLELEIENLEEQITDLQNEITDLSRQIDDLNNANS
jgi:peptidoglycan hydrolase CwlO-like protein